MKKITLAALVMFIGILSAFSQNNRQINQDSLYKSKKLKLEEANLVSSYYTQDGNNSAVTGGIGTEKLVDFSNTFDLKLSLYDKKYRKHNVGLDIGFDSYTSASSSNITSRTTTNGTTTTSTSTRPQRGDRGTRGGTSSQSGASSSGAIGTINNVLNNGITWTGASSGDKRFYPSINYQIDDSKRGFTLGANASFSTEYDYTSRGFGLSMTKTSKDKSREIGVKMNAFLDTWMVIYPSELRPAGYGTGAHNSLQNIDYSPRNTFNLALNLAQIINERFQVGLMVEPSYQQGLLATKYQRVYFTNGTAKPENLPDQRKKLPVSVRASYFLADRYVLRGFYRYYQDDWGLSAHTISLEPTVKISPFLSISPFYRFYTQKGIDYFAPYKAQSPTAEYFTSDYDLSTLTSNSFGAGIRMMPPSGVLGMKHFSSLELRYAHYERSTALTSNIVTVAMQFK